MSSRASNRCFKGILAGFGRSMNARVRRAVETDAEAIATLKTRSWQSAYRGQLPDPFLDDLGLEREDRIDFWRTRISMQSSARHEIWTAEVDGLLNGFAALGPARRDDERGFGELYALYVDPDHWSQGVGALLLTHAVQRLSREYPTAVLWVLESNVRARRFYERAGWSVVGGTKVESLRDGTELREVRYHLFCKKEKEE